MSADSVQTIRSQKLKSRRALSPTEVKQSSERVIQKLKACDFFKSALHVGVYRAIGCEINPWLDSTLFSEKQLYLPVMVKKPAPHLIFYAYKSGDRLLKRSFGIEEPDTNGTTPIPIAALDLLIVPMVAFDSAGHRVGYGMGYYDRSLAFKKNNPKTGPFLLGVAHQCQGVEHVPVNDWDVPMDAVITNESVFG